MPNSHLRKDVPPPRFNEIVPINTTFKYFHEHINHHFRLDGFQLITAAWLADAALLAYQDSATAKLNAIQGGFHDGEIVEAKNTQYFIASTDEFTIVAFRGTTVLKPGGNLQLNDVHGSVNSAFDALRDLMTDLTVLPADLSEGKVHAGFFQAVDEAWSGLKERLNPQIPVWFTGHSLGAALAVLSAQRYHDWAGKIGGVYTFGSPVIGDQNFVSNYSLHDRTFRFVNNNDWLPALDWVYQHVGKLMYIQSDGTITDADSYTDHLAGKAKFYFEYLKNKGFMKPDMIPDDSLADHAPVFYATHIWNCYVNQL